MNKKTLFPIASFAFSVICLNTANAQWSNNPTVNNAICTETAIQEYPKIISDGNGGAIITWSDRRNGTDNNIYAQRIDATGNIQWTAGGVVICNVGGDQNAPVIVSDGAGGAIIAWEDYFSGNSDIYAQRINSSGVTQWTLNGVAICSASEDQNYIDIISDGVGGAIMVWEDNYGSTIDVYIQKVNSAGVTQWLADGVAICTATGDQYTPKLAPDGSGGAVITWEDQRGADPDIYAQHINSAGTISGLADGIAVCNATGNQFVPSICSDGAGGAIFTWYDRRNGNWDIYAQKFISGGTPVWTANGTAICTASNDQKYPKLVSDQNGGAFITWQGELSASNNIYAQHINTTGNTTWTANGITICAASGEQYSPEIIADNSGGAIITWSDNRNFNIDIYAQRITASGETIWSTDGVEISTATNHQGDVKLISDGNDGAIFCWADLRNTVYDIYAQNVCASGWLGVCSSSINDSENAASISVSSSANSVIIECKNISEAQADLSILDITGKTIFSQNKVSTAGKIELNTMGFSNGIYLVNLKTNRSTYTAKVFIN
ncbi:MAG: T9SS type A sorting domain-containing protein [Bacteroidia bacterium]